jgi:hypothetical protein
MLSLAPDRDGFRFSSQFERMSSLSIAKLNPAQLRQLEPPTRLLNRELLWVREPE